jgi:hypothetical protein
LAYGIAYGCAYYTSDYTNDPFCLDLMEDQFKRPNRLTGKPFESGFQDESGRVFLRYLEKHGNDGYYLEEWKKDMETYKKKLNEMDSSSG